MKAARRAQLALAVPERGGALTAHIDDIEEGRERPREGSWDGRRSGRGGASKRPARIPTNPEPTNRGNPHYLSPTQCCNPVCLKAYWASCRLMHKNLRCKFVCNRNQRMHNSFFVLVTTFATSASWLADSTDRRAGWPQLAHVQVRHLCGDGRRAYGRREASVGRRQPGKAWGRECAAAAPLRL